MENVLQATPENVWAALQVLTEKLAETERYLNEKLDRLAEQQAETARIVAKAGRRVEETEEFVDDDYARSMSIAEEYYYNSLQKGKKTLMGEKFDILIKTEIIVHELDTIFVNRKSLVIVDVKYRVREQHVDEVMKKVQPFRERFPEYQNHKVYLCLASKDFDEDIVNKCKENGIAVIKQVGNSVVIHDENLKEF